MQVKGKTERTGKKIQDFCVVIQFLHPISIAIPV